MKKKYPSLTINEMTEKFYKTFSANLRKKPEHRIAGKTNCYFRKGKVKGFLIGHNLDDNDNFVFGLHLSKKVPISKQVPVIELLNCINQFIFGASINLHPQNYRVILSSFHTIRDGRIDRDEINNSIELLLDYGEDFFPIILKQINSSKSQRIKVENLFLKNAPENCLCIHDAKKGVGEQELKDLNV